jgi:hypothetical protein
VCVVECPHCKCFVQIEQVNCAIFRHGTYKHNGQQLNPHLPKAECDRLAATGAIQGCGKPFQLKPNTGGDKDIPFVAEVCDYI